MAKEKGEEEEFGKEIGLLHKVVVAGRKPGAGHTFWSALSDNPELLAEIVALVLGRLELTFPDATLVEKWLESLDGDCPFGEDESYTAGSPRSAYIVYFQNYHESLRLLFWKGKYNEKARALCEEVECYFILCYTLSAVWSHLNRVRVQWLNPPLTGLFTTFREVIEGASRTPRGWLLTLEHFTTNEAVLMVCGLLDKFFRWMDFVDFKVEAVFEMLEVCKAARDLQKQKILMMISCWQAGVSLKA